MGQFSVEKPVTPGSALSGNQQACGEPRLKSTPSSRDRRTMDSLPRWRREGLLSERSTGNHKPITAASSRYPKGTCAQIRAMSTLFKQKNRVDYVGFGFGGWASQ